MKELLKKQAGIGLVAIILIVVVVVVGGGAAALGIRMLVAGDGNYLKPFEDLGWIESEDEDDEKEEKKSSKKKVVDDDDDDDDDEEEEEKKKEKISGTNLAKYLVEAARLSTEAKQTGTQHYYGDIPLADEIGGNDKFADLYKLMKAGINVYAQNGKAVEIEFGFDISEFCEEAYKQFESEFNAMGWTSSKSLENMMMQQIETMFNDMEEDYSEYITKYVEGGSLQLYVTEKGFDAIYEEYDVQKGEKDVDIIIDALEEAFNTTISLVKD